MAFLNQEGTFRAHLRPGTTPTLNESSSGSERITLEVEVDFDDGSSAHILADLYLTDGAYRRSIEALRHMGWEGDDITDLSTVGSKEFEIVTEFEEYKGKSRLKVKWINALGGSKGAGLKIDAMPADKAKAFAAKMRGKIRALGGAGAAPAKTPVPAKTSVPAHAEVAAHQQAETPAAAQGSDDLDDIPF